MGGDHRSQCGAAVAALPVSSSDSAATVRRAPPGCGPQRGMRPISATTPRPGPPPEDDDPDPFVALTIYAFRPACKPAVVCLPRTRRRRFGRLQETFAIREPIEVEEPHSPQRALADAGTPATADSLVTAGGRNLGRKICGHGQPWVSSTCGWGCWRWPPNAQILERDLDGVLRSPGGNRFVFGGAYASPVWATTLLATSKNLWLERRG